MSLHIFGTILTPHGVAANNRGENEGNLSTLQKLLWNGEVHSTVSGEAIRYALRETWMEDHENLLNRKIKSEGYDWQDETFKKPDRYLDDTILGFMDPKKETNKRRASLEITRAVSTRPWIGDVSFNVASVGAQRTNKNPIPYAVEIHATRYQYSFALSGDDVKSEWKGLALDGLASLRRVAGNHSRFLYDFSPESIVLRVTHDPAPRILYCFREEGDTIDLKNLAKRVASGDVKAEELILGGEIASEQDAIELKTKGATVFPGIKAAVEDAKKRIGKSA
ncbi:type I-B CRISPR-associated protein Cas7/Cst2/DevR [Leptospira interrogans]|uniref:type I-B CRISPR-associated protein Cas7/Cst2/DevR n=1 Tax=Leptospira interrogans TaxID=173 RepID=UPI00193B7C84|nr:type I-B CRISPR-associated protein Cas7/Cst2/DevR [Leptospira interrogans]MBM2890321.1 type I-B CRISPR-associated protein Cas7/Cst2/DevR [Leptospira interrogans]